MRLPVSLQLVSRPFSLVALPLCSALFALHNGLCHYLIYLCLQQLTSLESLTSTPLCSNLTNAGVNSFFRRAVQEVLVAFFEGVCERVFGRTFALQSYPEYLEFFRRYAVPPIPDFLHAPIDQGPFWPTSGRWPFLQVSWGRVSCVPSSCPWPAFPGGSVGDSHSLGQVVQCPLLPVTSGPLRP